MVALLQTRDMPDQPGENRAMDRVVSGAAFIELERAQIIERVVQLGINVLPLAHAQVGKKALLAELPPLALGPQPVPLVVNRVPDIEQ